jgi:predicted Fe-S protein YdhL (DUF1289 family)
MVLSEKDFLLELESDKLSLKSLFSEAGKYDCPCKRKNMTNADWHKYKNGYMQKVWKLLHERSFKYLDKPSEDAQKKVFNFFNYDVKRIPCYVCRKHYTEFITNNNLKQACSCRSKLCKFLIDLHNDVNKDTKKPIMSYEEVFKLYGYELNKPVYTYPIKNPKSTKVESTKVESKKPLDKSNVTLTQKVQKLNHLFELNEKLISKQVFSNKTSVYKNNIIKKGMMNAINRGRK